MYQGVYINRCQQFGIVTYDLVIADSANVLPPVRASICVRDTDDKPAKKAQILADLITATTNDQLPAKRRERLLARIVDLDDLRATVKTIRDNIQADVDGGRF